MLKKDLKLISIIVVIISAVMSLMMAGCTKADTKIEGTYKTKALYTGSTFYEVGEIMDGREVKEDLLILELKADNSLIFTMNIMLENGLQSESISGQWIKSGNNVKLILSADITGEMNCYFINGYLLLMDSPFDYILIKA